MKLILLFALLALVGCNNSKEESESQQVFQRFDPLVVSPEDHSRIKEICDALVIKEERLPVLVNSAYTFSYADKKCNDQGVGPAADIQVTLQKPDSNYIFRRNGGDSFAFSNVETTQSGAMAKICASLGDLQSPMQTSSKGAIWFTTFTSTRYCASDFDSLCIHIQRGEHVNDLNYSIHTNEWIKFQIRGEKTGFFTERKLVSLADCPIGKNVERVVKLK